MSALCADLPLSLSLRSELASCEAARLALMAFLAKYQPEANALYKVELVLEEALMNQIRHAFPDKRTDHPLSLRAEVVADTVVLTFADQGVPFDPLQVAAPEFPSTLEAAVPGGLGIFLARKYAQSVAYERVGKENRLTVTVALH